jgi:O-antigen/teichoic acid export membrane protein
MVLAAVGIVGLALLDRLTLAGAFASYFVGALIPTVYLVIRLVAAPGTRPSLDALRLIFPYAWRTLGTIAATSATARLDQAVLAGVVRPSELGLYAGAVTAASVTSPLATGITQALFGHLRDERSAPVAAERFRRSLWVTTLVSGAIAGVMALLAPLVLRVVFGPSFEGATAALRILLPGSIAYNMLTVIGTKLYSDGRPGDAARAAVLGGIVTVGGLVLAIPVMGIEGAATVTSIAFVLEVVYLVRRGALRPAQVDASLDLEQGYPET